MNPARHRFWDLPSIVLLGLALVISAQRLVATEWTESLRIVFILAFFSFGLGLLLGFSRFGTGMVILLASLYSLVIIPMGTASMLYPGVPWLERMASMGGRLGYAFQVILVGAPLEDAFLFLVIFILGYWAISLGSAYSLIRSGNYLRAVLPGAVVLILLQIFDPHGDQLNVNAGLYLFLVLMLLGRMNYVHHRETWKLWRVFSSGEAKANLNLTVIVFAAVLVGFAWLLPVSSREIPVLQEWWQGMVNPLKDNENLTNVIAGLETDEELVVNEFYGRTLSLGQDAYHSDTAYFRILTIGSGGQERYYWRVRSYDLYQNGLWENSTFSERGFSARSNSLQLSETVGVNAEFTFKVLGANAGLLVTPARPVWVSRPARLTYLPIGDDLVDPISFQVGEPVLPGEEYLVHAALFEPSMKQLRLAGTDYPEWVSTYYLQLPADLPPSITSLAQEITAGADTPYDKAQAITTYLRNEITYATHVPLAPAGRDTLAWFLFDHKQGFCNYYATAEVVMLRAMGIPSRLVVGFGEGEYDSPGWYTVRQRDAHAWPEVYFPGLGWIEFEPTTAEPELVRPSGEEVTPAAVTSSPSTPQVGPDSVLPVGEADLPPTQGIASSNGQNSQAAQLAFFAMVILLGTLLAWAYISGRLDRLYASIKLLLAEPAPILAARWLEKNSLSVPAWLQKQAWFAGLDPLARTFMSVYRSLVILKVHMAENLTPLEAASTLAANLPQASEEVSVLLNEYLPAFFGTSPARQELAVSASRALLKKARHQRRELNRKRFFKYLK